MIVLEAKDDYRYGLLVGRAWGAAYRRIHSRTRPLSRAALRCRQAALEESYPQALERLEGLARAAGLERDRLLSAGPGNPLPLPGCTNFAAVPPATGDDQVYVSWNMDLPGFFRLAMGRFPLFVRRIGTHKPYLCTGSPLLFGLGIMNSDGLCAALNSVGVTDGGPGLTAFELNNLQMETCSTTEEAVALVEKGPRGVFSGIYAAILLNSNMLLADCRGEAAVVEYSHNHVAVTRASEHGGVLASANHHQFLDRGLSGCPDPGTQSEIAGSWARLARMWRLLELHRGRLDPEAASAITSDHGADYSTLVEYGIKRPWFGERIDDSTICAHPWNTWNHLRRGEIQEALTERLISLTLYRYLMQPLRCTVWLGRGYPCRSQYRPVFVGDLLEMPWTDKARGEMEPEGFGRALKERGGRGVFFSRPVSDTALQRAARWVLVSVVIGLDRSFGKMQGRS